MVKRDLNRDTEPWPVYQPDSQSEMMSGRVVKPLGDPHTAVAFALTVVPLKPITWARKGL